MSVPVVDTVINTPECQARLAVARALESRRYPDWRSLLYGEVDSATRPLWGRIPEAVEKVAAREPRNGATTMGQVVAHRIADGLEAACRRAVDGAVWDAARVGVPGAVRDVVDGVVEGKHAS